jgi:hypothetical protein
VDLSSDLAALVDDLQTLGFAVERLESRQQRALSHAEQRAATVDLVRRFAGEPVEMAMIEQRQKELSVVLTRR